MSKAKKWFTPMFDVDDSDLHKGKENCESTVGINTVSEKKGDIHKKPLDHDASLDYCNKSNWMKNFDPINVEELAVHNKKIQEVEQWLINMCMESRGEALLLSGPVGCGKTATVRALTNKHKIKITEWITPIDIDIPTEYGDYEYKQKQSTRFLDFIINAANFTSLIDNNSRKLVVVEDMPNTFLRTPSEFTIILQQYKDRAKSPIVFICSDSHTDNKNTALSLFTNSLKEQFNINHITFNNISPTGLRSGLKRVADIINRKFSSLYQAPNPDVIDCVVNSSAGDIRSAVLNLHFACLRGGKQDLDKSVVENEQNKKTKKRKVSSKFISIGKDDTVSILHAVGRVLNPKRTENGQNFTHQPPEVIEQFLGQPGSFVNFLAENYLPHFASIEDALKASAALSISDYMLAEWREKFCQEYGLYVAVAGLMLANKSPVSAWNPVRGPKSMKIQYPSLSDFPQLEPNVLYKGKVLVTDYQTYCKVIGSKENTIS